MMEGFEVWCGSCGAVEEDECECGGGKIVCGRCNKECVCEPEPETHSADVFIIDSDDHAEWILGKLADIDAAETRIKKNAEVMLEKLSMNRRWTLAVFGNQMREFCEAKRRQPGFKGKTVNFLHGKCNWRTTKTGGASVTNTEAALAYCQEHDELVDECVTVSYRLRTSDYLKKMEESGEVLPGIEIEPVQEVEMFYINGDHFR